MCLTFVAAELWGKQFWYVGGLCLVSVLVWTLQPRRCCVFLLLTIKILFSHLKLAVYKALI